VCVGWLVITEATELLNDFTQVLKKPETVLALLDVSENVGDLWDSYILSKYSFQKRKIIETYERFLIEIVKKNTFSICPMYDQCLKSLRISDFQHQWFLQRLFLSNFWNLSPYLTCTFTAHHARTYRSMRSTCLHK
jgi:hypothetical protein